MWLKKICQAAIAVALLFELHNLRQCPEYEINLQRLRRPKEVAIDIQLDIDNGKTRNHLEEEDGSSMTVTKRQETVMVLMNCLVTDEESMRDEINRLQQDVKALSMWHSKTAWFVNFVLPDGGELRKNLLLQASGLPDFVDIRISFNQEKSNKYGLVADVANDGTFLQYDFVLLKDSEIRLAGFPWNKFMNKKGDSVISGTLHGSKGESLARHSGHEFHEARNWKELGIPEFHDVAPLPTDFVEQAFSLFRTDFAHWFFNKALPVEFLSQLSDWGPDFMWCQAAHEFFPEKRISCSVVPVVALHEDTRQPSLPQDVMTMPLHIFQRDVLYSRWFQRSAAWVELIGGGVDVGGVLERCNSKSLTECAYNAAVTTSDWTSPPKTISGSNAPIYFLHVPKTGGTSMDSFMGELSRKLKRKYRGNKHYDWSYILQTYGGRDDRGAKEIDVVTLLREPVSRAVSSFHFAKTLDFSKDWAFRNQTLDEYLDGDMPWDGLQDGQGGVFWLSGTMDTRWDWCRTDNKDIDLVNRLREDRKSLALRAANRLQQTAWFGFLEDLPRSLKLLQHTVGLEGKEDLSDSFPMHNTNKHSTPEGETEKKMRSMIPMDAWLYDYAKLLFEARWEYYVEGNEYNPPELPPFPWDHTGVDNAMTRAW